jgi:hypothetical protein
MAINPPAGLIAMTNDLSSPLARAASQPRGRIMGALLPLHAEPESTPSTRTYLHTLAIGQLTALFLAQLNWLHMTAAIYRDGIAATCSWQSHLQRLGETLTRSAGIGRSSCWAWIVATSAFPGHEPQSSQT